MDTDSGRENYILGYGDSALAWMKSRTVEHHGAFLLPYLEPGMSLLDCGCGPGSLTLGFAAKLAPGSVVGIDCEPEQFAAAADTTKINWGSQPGRRWHTGERSARHARTGGE